MRAKYHWHNDPGHGWLAVPVADVVKAGVLRQVSRYSYHDGPMAILYLEEDCDAPLFIKAAGVDAATEVDDYYTNHNSFIRGLEHIDADRLADRLGVPKES